jgi:hypothetical protein
MGIRKPLRSLLAALALVACVHEYGRRFSFEDTKKLTQGVSTRVDAERLFGPPGSVTKSTDGLLICVWSYTHAGFMGEDVGTRMLLISFRPDGTFDRASETTTGADALSR